MLSFKTSRTLSLSVTLLGFLIVAVIYVVTRSISYPNQFGIVSAGHSFAKKEKSKLCVAVYGTTIDDENKIELIELLNIYKNNNDVYFFLDNLNNEMDYKLCDILSDPDRCIWHDADYRKMAQRSELYEKYILIHKTRIVFSLIKEMKLYNRCEYIIKLDSDAYVDVKRFGNWLSHNFNHLDDVYMGKMCFCYADAMWHGPVSEDYVHMMVQGIYTMSSGVFLNRPWLDFKSNGTMVESVMEDCAMGYLMTEVLKINVTDIEQYVIYGWNQTENQMNWRAMSYFERQCRFWCHKCTGKFREEFVRDTNYIPLHVDDCRFKGYDLGWHGNGSRSVAKNWKHVDFAATNVSMKKEQKQHKALVLKQRPTKRPKKI